MRMNDLYWSCASNCHGVKMLVRCPGARRFSTAVLRDYRLVEPSVSTRTSRKPTERRKRRSMAHH